jgi:1-deoxy-D-xylulose-5-phosphate reductoisomerase
MDIKRVIILGATGSIGQNSLEVCRGLSERIKVVGLSAHGSATALKALGEEWDITQLALSGQYGGADFPYYGPEGLISLIRETDADMVLNGIAGAAGFEPSVEVLRCGRDLALANKESIIMGGQLLFDLARHMGARILPVDSEHSALDHLLRGGNPGPAEELILTASGGPFRLFSRDKMARITVKDALNHPTWTMGPKITIDSATMANKGLEIMEAFYLFNMPPNRIKVIIHPQSHVHSLIRTRDGVLYAQISPPNMIHPIQNALTYPDILESPLKPLSLDGLELTFAPVDGEQFPMIPLAYSALEAGGGYPIAYNAANEVAVEAFLREEVSFPDIPALVKRVMQKDWSQKQNHFDQIRHTDKAVREAATVELRRFF